MHAMNTGVDKTGIIMKILFADKFPDNFVEQLTEQGHLCAVSAELTAEALPEVITDYEVLVVRSTKVTKAAIEAAGSLKLVIRAGAGTNTIDKACAREHGIDVCNVPGKNALAVAELAMGLLLSIDRNIADNVIDLRNGNWNKKKYSQARGVYGRKLGIVGLGSVGLALAHRAKAFGIDLFIVEKPDRSAQIQKQIKDLDISQVKDIDALVKTCDILSFHVPANDQTKGLVNKQMLDLMQPETIILNTARGEIIDEAALISAMNEKNIRAGLDVYDDEPGAAAGDFHSELAKHPNVYGTHHIGASTSQSQNAVAEGVIEVIESYDNGEVINCVNT